MSDDFTILNRGVGGDAMDECGVTYPFDPMNPTNPLLRKRPRVVVSGEGHTEIVVAANNTPAGGEYGLVTRPIVEYPGTSVVSFNMATLITANSETTVGTYTVPTGYNLFVLGFVASADVVGLYKFYANNSVKFGGRSSVSEPTLKIIFQTPLFFVPEGQTVKVTITHFQSGVQGDAEATIFGYIR